VAREVHEREDLLRDAVALVPRVLLRVALNDRSCEVFAGFRGESLSLYFGDDPVFHFNNRGELRRGYVNDRLIKAERGLLVALKRRRTDGLTALEGGRLNPNDERAFLSEMLGRLQQLGVALANGSAVVVGQVPEDGDVLARLVAWLAANPNPAIAASPRVG
jgi:hypothetical protein